jgi:hypothetical protein
LERTATLGFYERARIAQVIAHVCAQKLTEQTEAFSLLLHSQDQVGESPFHCGIFFALALAKNSIVAI